jgi:hypothetical protein
VDALERERETEGAHGKLEMFLASREWVIFEK